MPSFFAFRFSGPILLLVFFLLPLAGFPQALREGSRTPDHLDRLRAERLWLAQDHAGHRKALLAATGVSGRDVDLFFRYLEPQMRRDAADFLQKAAQGVLTAANAGAFLAEKQKDYVAAYRLFQKNKPALPAQKGSNPSTRHPNPLAGIAPLGAGEPCNNVDFESGTTDGWVGQLGKANYLPPNPAGSDPHPVDLKNSFEHHTLFRDGHDPIVGAALPRVAPGGRFSLRLEDTEDEGDASIISQTFRVDAASQYFTYRYAVVLEEPMEFPHADWQRPYFRVSLLDRNGNEIPCSKYSVLAKPPLEGFGQVQKQETVVKDGQTFVINRNYYWRGWTTVTIPLDKYVGQDVTVKFIASDCALHAHLGYAYLDGSCLGGLGIEASSEALCDNLSATLTAPEGFGAYQWTGPGITGPANVRQITADQPGNYRVALTPFANTAACAQAGQVSLAYSLGDGSGFTAGPDKTVCQGDTVTMGASGGNTYRWTPTTGLSNPNIGNPLAFPAVDTRYAVSSCGKTDSVWVFVKPKIDITAENDTVKICPGSTATLKVSGADRYEWSPADGLSATTGAQVNAAPALTTTYYVKGFKGEGCTDTDTITVIVKEVAIFGSPIVCSDSGGNTLKASGAKTYTWSPATGLDRTTGAEVLANPEEITTYTVTGVDAEGCVLTTRITLFPTPTETILTSVSKDRICSGQATQLFASGASSYFWYPSEGLSNPFTSNPIARPTVTTTYYVSNLTGCVISDPITVYVDAVSAGTPKDRSLCKGDQIQLQATYLPGRPGRNCDSYDVDPVAFAPLAGTGAAVTLRDNEVSAALPIGFDFTFYCSPYSQFYISSNGFITFSRGSSFGSTAQEVPNPNSPNNLVAFAWADLNPQGGGSIDYFTTGTAPNRRLVINFRNVPQISITGALERPVTAQVILHETTNVIDMHITSVVPDYRIPRTMGIENANGTKGHAVPGRNRISTWSAANEAWRFTPPQTITYSWSPALYLDNPSSASPVATPEKDMEYIVTLSTGLCTTTDTVRVKVNPRPEVTVQGNDVICTGASTTLEAKITSPANIEYFYEWFPAEGLSSTKGLTVVAKPAKTTTYTVKVLDGNGCVSSAELTVTVNALPKIVLHGKDGKACRGSLVELAVNEPESEAHTYEWKWKDHLGADRTASGPAIGDHPEQTTVYTVTGTNTTTGCVNTAIRTITVPESSLQVAVAPNASVCLGETVTLTASGAMTATDDAYAWLLPDGSTTQKAVLTQKPTAAGTYTYKITATDTCGNVIDREVLIVVNALPKVVAQPQETAVCLGSAAELSVDAASNAARYTWSTLTGTEVGTGRKVLVKPAASTQYVLTGTDGNGCVSSDTVGVTVHPLPVVTASPDKAICSGEFADLRAKGALSYEWTDGTGTFATGDSIRVTPARTTTYYATGTDGNGCTDTARVTVIVRDLFTSPDTAICAGDYARLAAGVGYDRYTWTASPALAALEGERVVVRPDTSTTYTVAASAPGCNAIGRVRVTVVPRPVVHLGPDTLICPGETVALRAGPGGARYRWTNLAHEDITVISADSVLLAAEPGLYTVEVFNRLGCSVADTVRLTACSSIAEKYPLFIPNVITPNGDSANDTWTVRNLDKYGANKVVIYNRWGHEVYRVNNYHNDWQGVNAANGVYYYHLWLEEGNRLFKGWIHVQR